MVFRSGRSENLRVSSAISFLTLTSRMLLAIYPLRRFHHHDQPRQFFYAAYFLFCFVLCSCAVLLCRKGERPNGQDLGYGSKGVRAHLRFGTQQSGTIYIINYTNGTTTAPPVALDLRFRSGRGGYCSTRSVL